MLALATALAVLVGVALGLLGGGGSILTVPLLVYVAGLDPKQAIASGLFVVGVTSLVGLVSHARGGRVQWRTGLVFGSAGMVGAFVGARIGAHLPGSLLIGAFALMMLATAIAMIRGRQATTRQSADLPVYRMVTDGALVGLVTGTVGAGGGFLVVPALAMLGGLPMPIAVGTSLLVISMNTLSGFASYASSTAIDWRITLFVTAAAVVGAVVGSRLAGRVPPERLRAGFGWFVLVMAGVMLVQELDRETPLPGVVALVLVVLLIAAVLVAALRPRARPVESPHAAADDRADLDDLDDQIVRPPRVAS